MSAPLCVILWLLVWNADGKQLVVVRGGLDADLDVHLVSMDAYVNLADIVDSPRIPLSGEGEGHLGVEAAQKLLDAERPMVVFLQRTSAAFSAFLDTLEKSASAPPSFVLLAVNGDPPMTNALQLRIAKLRGLKACYATEMHPDAGTGLFYPMPLGMRYHEQGNYEPVLVSLSQTPSLLQVAGSVNHVASVVAQVKSIAPKFKDRIAKLLVPPLGKTHPSREAFLKVLSRPEYRELAHVEEQGRSSVEEYMKLMSTYKVVLSPPGFSYDCFRTWEALALGTAPALLYDEKWNMGLYRQTNLSRYFLPSPEALTPENLRAFLQRLADPEDLHPFLTAAYWNTQWRSKLVE